MPNFPSPIKGNGGGLTAIPNRFKFDDTAAREAYFNGHKKDLVKLQTLILVGDKAMIWTGSTNPSVYTPSRWSGFSTTLKGDKGDTGASGAGVDLSGLSKNEIPVYDPVTKQLVSSGVKANLGEIEMAPGTLLFGNHRMSSSNENVVFTNEDTKKNYTPVWQEQKVGSKDAYMRIISDTIEEVVRVPVGTEDVINPINKDITVSTDEVFFGGKFILSKTAQDVIMEAFDKDGHIIWKEQLGDLDAGEHEVTFQIPLDIRAGFKYSTKIRARGGDGNITVKGPNAGTGLPFSWTAKRATWVDTKIAKLDDLDKLVNDVDIADGNIVVTSVDNTVTRLRLPTTGTGASSQVNQNVINQEIPVWNDAAQQFDPSGIVLTSGGLIIPSQGAIIGSTKITPDGRGFSINPLNETNSYKPLMQAITDSSNDAFIRSYSPNTAVTAQAIDTSDVTNPSSVITSTLDAVVYSLDMKVTKAIKELIIKLEDSSGVPLWSETFGNLDAGEQTLLLNNPFDIPKDTNYTIKFSGVSVDGSVDVVFKGNGSNPYLKFKILPYVWEKIATVNYVNDQDTKLKQDISALKAKLPSGGSSTEPVIHEIPTFYGVFSETWPDTITGADTSVGSRIVISNKLGKAARVFILVPLTHSSSVTGIKQGDGIPSLWASGDLTIQGVKYKAFYSPRALHEDTATFTLTFAKEVLYV